MSAGFAERGSVTVRVGTGFAGEFVSAGFAGGFVGAGFASASSWARFRASP